MTRLLLVMLCLVLVACAEATAPQPSARLRVARATPAASPSMTPTATVSVPPTPSATPRSVQPPLPQRECDPAYAAVCIPLMEPFVDLNCDQIRYRRFVVGAADPHRFDGDHDGIACEAG